MSAPSQVNVADTGEYYYGNLYLARARFHLDFPGAANHCSTDGI